MLTVKFEQMYPIREFIEVRKFDDRGLSVDQVTMKVELYIETKLHRWVERHPSMTELRWEYEEIGQGHYQRVVADDVERSQVWIGKLTYEQLIDVLKRAVQFEDYNMAEGMSYLIRLRQDCPYYVATEDIELPMNIYKFDWMTETDDEGVPIDCDEPEQSEELIDEDQLLMICQMVPNLEPNDEYYRLAEAVKQGLVGFESNGQWIINPFYDETLRDDVDPQGYYGWATLKQWL